MGVSYLVGFGCVSGGVGGVFHALAEVLPALRLDTSNGRGREGGGGGDGNGGRGREGGGTCDVTSPCVRVRGEGSGRGIECRWDGDTSTYLKDPYAIE